MPPPIWTLNASGITPPASAGLMLVGCHITVDPTGTMYLFTEPNPNNVLAIAGPPLPAVPFTFPRFAYKGLDWDIEVSVLPVGLTGNGRWHTPGDEKSKTPPQSGDYLAQAGVNFDAGAAAA